MATLSVNSFGALEAPLTCTSLVMAAAASQVYTLPSVGGTLFIIVSSCTLASIIFGRNNTFSSAPLIPLSVGTYAFAYKSNSTQVQISTGPSTGAITATLWANQVALS